MFTGIIEATGIVESVETNGNNKVFLIRSPISGAFQVDQSVSHDGVCLTIEAVQNNIHQVTAVRETVKKTNIGTWNAGSMVNLERSMLMNGRLDGHIVQGHVDATAICKEVTDANGSWEFKFEYPDEFAELVIEKGSICLNGISLTVFNTQYNTFSVAVIPYTYEHTNIHQLIPGTVVNIEFDIIGKYVNRILSVQKNKSVTP